MGRLALLGLVAVLALAACGGGSRSNGEAKKSAAQVVTDAQAAVRSASIVHVVGSSVENGRPLELDLWIGDGKGKGRLHEEGFAFDLVRIGNAVYVKAAAAFWKRFGNAAAATLLHDRWVKIPTGVAQVKSIIGLADKTQLFSTILGRHGRIENRGETELQGRKVVEIRDTTRGGSLYVAAEGTPYPVAVKGGKERGDVTFGDWNADETIAAPKGAVDLSSLGG